MRCIHAGRLSFVRASYFGDLLLKMTILRYQLVIIFLFAWVFMGVSSAQSPAASPTPNDGFDRRSTGVHITNPPGALPQPQLQQYEDRTEESAQERLQRESARVPEFIPLPPDPDLK